MCGIKRKIQYDDNIVKCDKRFGNHRNKKRSYNIHMAYMSWTGRQAVLTDRMPQRT